MYYILATTQIPKTKQVSKLSQISRQANLHKKKHNSNNKIIIKKKKKSFIKASYLKAWSIIQSGR